MSYKMEQALGALGQSIEKLEECCKIREQKKQAPRAATAQDQNDLFSSTAGSGSVQQGVDTKAMAVVLDRTIHKMEKLVNERS